MNKPSGSLEILHLLLSAGETSADYNEYSLPLANRHKIAICTFFKPQIIPPKEVTVFEGDGSFIGFFRGMKEAMTKKRFDIIHAHSPHVGFLFLMATTLKRGWLCPAKVYTVHSSYPNYKLRNRLMLAVCFAFFQEVVCCSKASFESFPGFFKWLAGDRLRAVQNCVDIGRVDRVIGGDGNHVRGHEFTITTVGRIMAIKNPLAVLRAFQLAVDQCSRLVVIGEGPLLDALKGESGDCGLGNRIELTGLIPRDDVYRRLSRADLFISASRIEGLPVAVLEAMACRCPVVLSDIPPHREIAAGVDFIPLIQPDDAAGFAQEIKRFRQMSVGERARIGQSCRTLVEERFSLSTMHQKYEAIYSQLIYASQASPFVLCKLN